MTVGTSYGPVEWITALLVRATPCVAYPPTLAVISISVAVSLPSFDAPVLYLISNGTRFPWNIMDSSLVNVRIVGFLVNAAATAAVAQTIGPMVSFPPNPPPR